MNKRPLAPKFLNRLDNYLLLNRPDTWSTRFHLVAYYVLLFSAAVTAVCFIAPESYLERSFFGLWSGSIGVLCFIGIVLWLVFLFRFNVFKQFGKVFPGDRLKTLLLYFFTFVLFSVPVYIPPIVESIRTNAAYSSDELATDINRINVLMTKMEHDAMPVAWSVDTINIVPGNYSTSVARPNFIYCDSNELQWRLREADSVRWMRKDLVLLCHCTPLQFVTDNRVARYSKVHVLTNVDLYNTAYLHPAFDPVASRRELNELVEKYHSEDLSSYYYENDSYSYNHDDPEAVKNHLKYKYDLYNAESGINNISEKKYRWRDWDYTDILIATWYYCIIAALLVFIFRHSTVKTFFLSLLLAIVLSILSGLFVAVLSLRESGIYFLMLAYFVVFVIMSLMIPSARYRSVITGIALNAFVLMVSFIPIILVALFYANYNYGGFEYYPYASDYYIQKTINLHIAEVTGAVILLVLIETLFKKLYRKWYSLPED